MDDTQDELDEHDISEEERRQTQREHTAESVNMVSLITTLLRSVARPINFIPSIFCWSKAQWSNSLVSGIFIAFLWPIASFSAQLVFVLFCIGFAVYIAVNWVIQLPVVGIVVTSLAQILWKSICILFGRPFVTHSPLGNWMSSTRLFFSNTLATFTRSFSTASPTTAVSLFPGHNFTTQFNTIIDETSNLTQLGIDILPITLVIRHAIKSVSTAGSIVQASDIFEKHNLVQRYRNLQNSTEQLWAVMSKYDSQVRAITQYNELNLESLIRKTNEILSGTDPNASVATVTFQLPTFLAVASFFTLFLPHSVRRRIPPMTVASAIIVFSQAQCLISPSVSRTFCEPVRTLLVTGTESRRRTRVATEVGAEIRYCYQSYLSSLGRLDDLVVLGLEVSNDVDKHLVYTTETRLLNENRVAHALECMAQKDSAQPPWYLWLFKSRGLTLQDKYTLVQLKGQGNHLNELRKVHQQARAIFEHTFGVLQKIKDHQAGILQTIEYLQGQHVTQWDFKQLVKEIGRLYPVAQELKQLNEVHHGKQQEDAYHWRKRFEVCIAGEWENWEACMFGW